MEVEESYRSTGYYVRLIVLDNKPNWKYVRLQRWVPYLDKQSEHNTVKDVSTFNGNFTLLDLQKIKEGIEIFTEHLQKMVVLRSDEVPEKDPTPEDIWF